MKQQNSIFLRPVLLSLLMLFPAMEVLAAAANMKMAKSSTGFVMLKAENALFYRYSAVFTAESDTKLLFKEGGLILTDKTGKQYAQGWLNITFATAGVSFSQQAPIDLRTLIVESEDGHRKAIRWNLSKVAGPDGALEFTVPKGGQVTLDFLWQVPKEFKSGRIKIGTFPEVLLPVEGYK